MAPIRDLGSLQELRESVRGRAAGGSPRFGRSYDQLHLDSPPTQEQTLEKASLEQSIGLLYMYEGKFLEAAVLAREGAGDQPGSRTSPPRSGTGCMALLGIVALRRGEIENCLECVGPSSCIFPIAREAVHQQPVGLARGDPSGSRPTWRSGRGDLRVRWLLNLAYMTLGEYPEKVPPQVPDPARAVPLEARRGPVRERRPAGRPDGRGARTWPAAASSTTSTATACPTSSPPRSTPTGGPRCSSTGATARSRTGRPSAGLGDQVYALNVTRADFDNDGDLDVLLLRGGWENAAAALALAEQRGRRASRT